MLSHMEYRKLDQMTGEQIGLVKTSFKKIERVSEEAAVLFYARLFELDPGLRPLFKDDMSEQRLKLMQMLEFTVNGLDRVEELVPAVRALGARHVGYGVKEHHYETVRDALLWTFSHAADVEFNEKTREAWTAVYGLVAGSMKDGARAVQAGASH
jgi:hemoglobin-like flavoprotein